MTTTSLDKRIAAALASDATSAEIAVLIPEVDAAVVAAVEAAERERIKSYDPVIVDPQKARQSLADAEFVRDRLQAALAALQERRQELLAQEYLKQWHREYAQVEAESHSLAAELSEVYLVAQSQLVDVLTRKQACDAKVGRINGSAPPGVALRLREVELVARNLDGFTRDEPSITKELRLPDWDQSNKLAWPRPQTPLAVLAVQGVAAAVDHPGDNWWRRRDERLPKL
jgi:hypothetical protein